eukprot:CAMPEP_0172728442 /NCGR_PEP_ID=MMETSP1074-20121228/92243_1 /TAXON_ID=2916 /ORGANISM="Ceratium fusus, Strain PA161109" /LENGTH=216 /DNA_ID=CAMNT_0013555691 /DNA_START=1 /DNA_END=648 /DNA_ORIENTATION=+
MHKAQDTDERTATNRDLLQLAWSSGLPRKAKRPHCVAFCDPDDDELEDDDERNLRHAPAAVLALESAADASLRKQAEGKLLAEAGRFGAALACWDAALELQPSGELHEMRAQAFLAMGRYFEAVQAAEAAVCVRPDWWPAHLTLGRARFNFGEIELAARALARAAALEPQSQEIQDELAEVQELGAKLRMRVETAVAKARSLGNASEQEAHQCIAE